MNSNPFREGEAVVGIRHSEGLLLTHLLGHYQTLIVYVGFSFWRKLVVQTTYQTKARWGEQERCMVREKSSSAQAQENIFLPSIRAASFAMGPIQESPAQLGVTGQLRRIGEVLPEELLDACKYPVVSFASLNNTEFRGVGGSMVRMFALFFNAAIRHNQKDLVDLLLKYLLVDLNEAWDEGSNQRAMLPHLGFAMHRRLNPDSQLTCPFALAALSGHLDMMRSMEKIVDKMPTPALVLETGSTLDGLGLPLYSPGVAEAFAASIRNHKHTIVEFLFSKCSTPEDVASMKAQDQEEDLLLLALRKDNAKTIRLFLRYCPLSVKRAPPFHKRMINAFKTEEKNL